MDYVTLGKRIRKARQLADMSQEELAEKCSLSSQHISHIENASTKVSLPALVEIANALNKTVDQLLTDNIKIANAQLSKEVNEVFRDASGDEMYVMLEAAKAVKRSLRIRKLAK